MVFSERQKLAEEIIFLSEKRGITANGLRANEGRVPRIRDQSASRDFGTANLLQT